MQIAEVVETETDPLILPLTENGVALNGTGFTVTNVYLTDRDGTPVDTTGKFTWSSASTGLVQYAQSATEFVAERSPYLIRVEITDGNGKTRDYPNGEIAEITVHSRRGR